MKIDLSTINRDQFMCHTHMIGNEMVMLVQPVHIGCEWDGLNDIFRSSVWNLNGELISASFKKFVNWGEKPHLYPVPTSLAGAHLIEKVDGSTLIFSRWKGNTIIRTRGTVDARKQENGHEIDVLLAKYPKFLAFMENCETSGSSFIFEWTSPTNQIVINYGFEPDMVLTGIVRHVDYSYENQATLDTFAEVMGLCRPQTYAYDSVEAMKQAVTDFKGIEGVCVYFHDDQKILKVKGAQYLYLHRAKSEISSIEKVMDLYLATFLENGSYMPYQSFMEYLEKTFDFEIAQMARSNVSLICDGMKEVRVILTAMRAKLATISGMSRKDQAGIILQAWGTTGRSALAFKMLDNKALVPDDYKKLLFQILK
jgi:hypothetical protein